MGLYLSAYSGFGGSIMGLVLLIVAVGALAYGCYKRHVLRERPRFSFGLSLAPPGMFTPQVVGFVAGAPTGKHKHKFRNLNRNADRQTGRRPSVFGN